MSFNPLALMGNNPLIQILNMAKNGGDPSQLINQAINNHPQRQQIQQIIGGKDPQQLMRVAENMCRERGTSIDEVLKQFGISR